ncbi:hypothetical protein GW7_16280 [Heterocephalus glaber]|uniref:Uncharacterized protein n=1 Tax=Heterocephalus glaber TaxID=10181 RepID=G5AM19_HETGA|nr:hypothetical protein GW7_16280 [Heterocephalus glaber]
MTLHSGSGLNGTFRVGERLWCPKIHLWNHARVVITWMPLGASNQTSAISLLDYPLAERNSTNSTRALWLLEGMSAVWYILTIIGFFGVIFLFQLASNILRKNDKSLEDIYYSNLTFELKKKGLQSKMAKCSSLIISNTAVLQPSQASLVSKCGNSGPQTGAQGIP